MSILVSSNSSPILLESSRKDEVLNSPTENSSVVINNDSLLLSRYAATLYYLEENELKQVPALYHHKTTEKSLHCIVGGSAVEEEDTESEDDDEDHFSSRGAALNEQHQGRKTPPKSDVPVKSAAASFLNRVPLSSSISHPVLPPIQTYSPQLNLSVYSPCSTPISSIRSKKSRIYTNSALNFPSCLLDTSITVQNPTNNNLSSFNNNRQKPLYSSTLTSSSSFASTIKMDIRSPPQPSQSTSRFMNAFQRFRSSSINQSNKNANNNSVAPAEIMSTTIKPSPSKSSLADKIKTKFQQLDKKKRSSLIDTSTSTRKNSVKTKKKNLSAEKTPTTFSMPRSASISSITNWSSRLTANNKLSSLPTTKISTKQQQNRLSKSTSLTSFLSSRTGQSLKPSLSSSSSSSCSSSEAATTSLSSAASPTNNNGPLSLTKSISSHRLYKNTNTTHSDNTNRPRQPLRAVNPNDSVRLARNSFQSQQQQQRQKKKGGKTSVIRFTKLISVRETYSKGDYDRGSDPEAVCTRLTPAMAQQIKEELNAYKLHEMQVHEYSRVHTHFFL